MVRGLHISGNHALSSRDIEKQIATSSTGWWPLATKRYFDDAIWDADLRRIVRFYESRGYYQARIVHSNVTPRPHDGVELDVEIDEGQPTRVSAIDIAGIDGLPEADRRAALDKPAVTRGQPFTEHGWASLKSSLHDRLRDRGYAEVAVDGKALVDVETRQAALDVSVRPGQRYRFGELQIDTGGGKAISPDWIRAEVRAGDRARRGLLERRPGRGAASADRHGSPGRGARRAGHARSRDAAGAGQGHDQRGAAAHARLRRRPAHRSDPQRGPRDRRVEQPQLPGRHAPADPARRGGVGVPARDSTTSFRSSEPTRNGPIARARGEFEQPRLFGHASLRELTQLELEHTLEQTYDATAARLGNGIVWKPRSALEIHPSYHVEVDRLTGPPGAGVLVAPLTLGCTTTTQSCVVWLSYLEEAVVWDRRNNPLEPRHGYYASLSLQQGGGPLGGNFTYLRFLPELRGYVTVGEDDDGLGGFTLASRVRFGELMPSSGNPDDSAVVTRFYSGGAFSMRGFNEQRLSPLLLTSQPPTAGNPNPALCHAADRRRRPVRGQRRGALRDHRPTWILALFMDVGQVTRGTFDATTFAHMMFAVGAGLRYRTPIGPIRVDFARRLPFGTPPQLFAVEPPTGRIVQLPYAVDDSCFGLGGSNVTMVVPDNLCVLHISIGEAF